MSTLRIFIYLNVKYINLKVKVEPNYKYHILICMLIPNYPRALVFLFFKPRFEFIYLVKFGKIVLRFVKPISKHVEAISKVINNPKFIFWMINTLLQGYILILFK